MPRAKKTKRMFTVEIEASVIITACYEIESCSLVQRGVNKPTIFVGE